MTGGFTDRNVLLDTLTPEQQRAPIVLELDVLDNRRVKAILVADPADRRIDAWLPRSQIKTEPLAGGRLKVTLPTWLALEKGLTSMVLRGQGRLL